MTLLPRPAFIEDLARLAVAEPDLRVAVIADSTSEAALAMLDRWVKLLPLRSMSLVLPKGMPLDRIPVSACCVIAGGTGATDLAISIGALTRPPHYIVTCEPYDAYGVYVKPLLEGCLLSVMDKCGASLLVHDASQQTLRVYTAKLLRDRLQRRPGRLALYRWIVRCMFCVARKMPVGESGRWHRVGTSR